MVINLGNADKLKENVKVKMAARKKAHYTKRYKRIRVKSPNYFDKRSLRTKDVGRRGYTKIIVGCPKGKYDARRKKCKVGTKTQTILMDRKDFGI